MSKACKGYEKGLAKALQLAQITPTQLKPLTGHVTTRQMEALSGSAIQEWMTKCQAPSQAGCPGAATACWLRPYGAPTAGATSTPWAEQAYKTDELAALQVLQPLQDEVRFELVSDLLNRSPKRVKPTAAAQAHRLTRPRYPLDIADILPLCKQLVKRKT